MLQLQYHSRPNACKKCQNSHSVGNKPASSQIMQFSYRSYNVSKFTFLAHSFAVYENVKKPLYIKLQQQSPYIVVSSNTNPTSNKTLYDKFNTPIQHSFKNLNIHCM